MALVYDWLFPQSHERPNADRITAELATFLLDRGTRRPVAPVSESAMHDGEAE